VELKRLQDFNKAGSQAEPGSFFGLESAFKGTGGENGYPGGVFDPLGFSRRARRAVPAAGALPLVPGSDLTGLGRDRAAAAAARVAALSAPAAPVRRGRQTAPAQLAGQAF